MIEIRNLVVERGGCAVVNDVSLDVSPGEFVVLVGPNGSGKSSLVGAVSGDLRYSQGSVRIGGLDVSTTSRPDLARQRSVMTQNNPVSFGFTVREVVGFGRSPWRATSTSEHDAELIDSAISKLDLQHLADRPVQALSGGELARVAMARALAQDTATMILDEPTAALDLRHQVELLSIVREQVTQGRSALVVLHDLTLAAQFADRVAVLQSGRVAAQGPPQEVLAPQTLSQIYGVQIFTLTNPETSTPVIVAGQPIP